MEALGSLLFRPRITIKDFRQSEYLRASDRETLTRRLSATSRQQLAHGERAMRVTRRSLSALEPCSALIGRKILNKTTHLDISYPSLEYSSRERTNWHKRQSTRLSSSNVINSLVSLELLVGILPRSLCLRKHQTAQPDGGQHFEHVSAQDLFGFLRKEVQCLSRKGP